MLTFPTRTKAPNARRLITRNWRPWLKKTETIESAVWAVDGPDNALTVEASTYDQSSATARIAGGTLGASYRLTCTITTSLGQEWSASVTINVQYT
ncbi:MAG TPA: hypothetical protein VN764_00785 [Polyangiaceae bacterium]|nr:hypothetical protein [Polyangiaceae bacterium]